MFGIGSTEFLVIIVVAVLVLGPEHLPKVMRTFSKVMSEFRKVSTDFQRAINLEAVAEEQKQAKTATPKKKKKKKTVVKESDETVNASSTMAATQTDEMKSSAAAQQQVDQTLGQQRNSEQTELSPLEELAKLTQQQQEAAVLAHSEDNALKDETRTAALDDAMAEEPTGIHSSRGPAV